MLKHLTAALLLTAAATGTAQAATIVLLPDPGSMSGPTIIVDPNASRRDPVLVCSSLAQVTSGGCVLRNWTGLRRAN